MAPLTRSAASTGPTRRSQAPPKEPEILNIDEDEGEDEDLMDEEEEVYYEDEEGDYDDEEQEMDETMDETMDDVNGDGASESGSVFRASERSLKSMVNFSSRAQDSPKLFTASGAQEVLQPLRRTADRVTRQIEAFAEKLEQFKRKNATDEFHSIQAAYKLVESYRDLAQNAIQDINKEATLRRAKTGFRSSGVQDGKADEEVQRLQLEVDTWRLLLNLISIDDPASRASFKEGRQSAFQNLHRYSTDREVWEEFLSADHYALECVIAMRWLEETSKTGNQDLDSLILDMESQAERGQGLWAHGWLFTKEAIKGHKRLRAWPQPLESNDPSITRSLLSNDEQRPLITQLDPDALTRQKRGLQGQDEFYERATWMACWKMLPTGRKLDHNSRCAHCRSHDSWRSACAALARSPNTDDFQRAVYALLCGESEPAAKVCRSWDDYLYVYFNRVVLSRYQGFCKQFQRKLSHSPTTPVVFQPEPAGHTDLQKFFQYLRGNEQVGGEARNPFRNIQAAILSKGYDSFFSLIAQAISQVSARHPEKASIIPPMVRSQVDEAYLIAAADEESLKIATHIYLIVNSIGYARADTQFMETASVLVAGYITNLEGRGLYDLIPLYASVLPREMSHNVISRILIEITEPRERKQQIRLLQKHGVDISAVLDAQWAWLSTGVSQIDSSGKVTGYPRVVRRENGVRVLTPPKKDLIGTFIADEDEKMIRSLEWLRYVGGQWPKICKLGAWLYRKFFVAGKLAAARELSHRVRLAELSQESFGFDIFQFPVFDNVVAEDSAPASPSKSKRNSGHFHRRSLSGNGIGIAPGSGTDHSLAYQQCIRMYNLETLALGFDSLEQFAIVYDQISKTKRRRDSGTVKNHLHELEELLQEVEMNVGLIVDEWLSTSINADEEQDYAYIRKTYLPELILDYHNALYYASHSLDKPTLLTQCMTVSIWVANVPHLTRAFTEAQRMAELMDALALASKAMVLTDSEGGDRVFENGQTLGIWRVKVPEDDESDLLQQSE
ncbi:hypothetical protein N7526_000726 [Penicillium atrosanguineum]|nr:hypothetical protein N7526_000726 [Penicillium atrosanguineum]